MIYYLPFCFDIKSFSILKSKLIKPYLPFFGWKRPVRARLASSIYEQSNMFLMTIYIIGICNVSIISSHDKNKERKRLLNPILRNKIGYTFQNDSVTLCYCIFLSMTVLLRGIEWSLRASASMRAECLFLRARACDKQLQKFCEHDQANTHLIFASNSSKGQILRALLN